MERADLIALARRIAEEFNLPPELVCAVCEQESSWNPSAGRYEEAYFRKYIAIMGLDEQEEIYRSSSWGLMQIMGETAREFGFRGPMDQLLIPEIGLTFGCKYLENRIMNADGNTEKALLLWNGGGNPRYPEEVLARVPNYTGGGPNVAADTNRTET